MGERHRMLCENIQVNIEVPENQRKPIILPKDQVGSCFNSGLCPWVRSHHWWLQDSSVQFSRSVVADSSQPHESQHARPPCLSPTPRIYSNSCPLSRWCHPTISSSVVPFSHLQSFPASGSFPMSQFFSSSGQSIGSFGFSISPSNEKSGLISFRMDSLDLLAS